MATGRGKGEGIHRGHGASPRDEFAGLDVPPEVDVGRANQPDQEQPEEHQYDQQPTLVQARQHAADSGRHHRLASRGPNLPRPMKPTGSPNVPPVRDH